MPEQNVETEEQAYADSMGPALESGAVTEPRFLKIPLVFTSINIKGLSVNLPTKYVQNLSEKKCIVLREM